MPNVLQVPVGIGVASLVWNGRPADGVNSLLLINQDLNNTIYIGNEPGITSGTGNVVPILANGSLSVDPASPWYVVGAAAGIKPLVMVPNGNAAFLGITAGLGNLVIPSVQSPNFVHNNSGWQIAKDGSAEFNNLTIRGTFFGLDFEINNNGAFFYNGTPANGNLKISIVSNGGGTDEFGNVYLDNITAYNVANANGGFAQIAANPSTGIPYLVLDPPGTVTNTIPPQITSGVVNGGAANECVQLNIDSGIETGTNPNGAAVLQLVSRSNDATILSLANMLADRFTATLADANVYSIGAITQKLANPFTVNNTAAQQVTGMVFNVTPGQYHINGVIRYQAAAAGVVQPMSFQFHASAGISSIGFVTNMWVEAGGTTANPGVISALATGPTNITGNVPNNTVCQALFDGYITVTSAGTFGLFANQVLSAADETFTIQASGRTWWRLEPQ